MVLPLFTRPTAPRLATGDSIDQVDTNHPLDNSYYTTEIQEKQIQMRTGRQEERKTGKERRGEEEGASYCIFPHFLLPSFLAAFLFAFAFFLHS